MIIKFITFLIGKISPKDISGFIASLTNILTPEQKKALGEIALKAIEAAAAGAVQGAVNR
jgi:hypothetical protein